MKVVAGLGNPGEEYRLTRHNVGYLVVDKTVEAQSTPHENEYGAVQEKHKAQNDSLKVEVEGLKWGRNRKLKAQIAQIGGSGELRERVLFVKPKTYMNRSGEAVRKIVDYYGLECGKGKGCGEQLFVVHDELDLPIGSIQIRRNIGAGGHNGIQSVIEHLGTRNFVRFRVGVGKSDYVEIEQHVLSKFNKKDYLLSDFTKREWEIMEPTIERAAETVIYAVKHGVDAAMNKFNNG